MTAVEENSLCDTISSVRENIDSQLKLLRVSITALKTLEKQVRSLEGKYNKLCTKKKKKINSDSVPGFLIPSPISDQLRDFMMNNYKDVLNQVIEDSPEDTQTIINKKNKDRKVNRELLEIIPNLGEDCKIPRARVTQFIARYIKYHGIQKENNKTFVDMETDAGKKLNEIFKGNEGKEVTFYGLSKFTTHHFLKSPENLDDIKQVPEPVIKESLKKAKDVTKRRRAARLVTTPAS